MTRFPARVEELTPELLTSVMRERQPEVRVESFRIIETSPQNYGEAITVANLERLVAAVQDLETISALAAA